MNMKKHSSASNKDNDRNSKNGRSSAHVFSDRKSRPEQLPSGSSHRPEALPPTFPPILPRSNDGSTNSVVDTNLIILKGTNTLPAHNIAADEDTFRTLREAREVELAQQQSSTRRGTGGALMRMHKALTSERKSSALASKMKTKRDDQTLRVYSWDEVIDDDKINPKMYDCVFVFPANGSSVNEFYAAEVAPFEGARQHHSNHKNKNNKNKNKNEKGQGHDDDLENCFEDNAKVWGPERYAEFFLGVVTESLAYDYEEELEFDEDYSDGDGDGDGDASSLSFNSKGRSNGRKENDDFIGVPRQNSSSNRKSFKRRDSSASMVSHLMSMVKSRVTVDSAKVIFQTASSLTCNLTNKMILAREMQAFRSREAVVQRLRLKLIAVNAFVKILKKIRFLDTMRKNAIIDLNNAQDQYKSTRHKNFENVLGAVGLRKRAISKRSSAIFNTPSMKQALKEANWDKLHKITGDMNVFDVGQFVDEEMIEYKEKIRTTMRKRGATIKVQNDGNVVITTKRSESWLQKSKTFTMKVADTTLKKGQNNTSNRISQRFGKGKKKQQSTKQHDCCGRTPAYWDDPKPLQFVGEAPYALMSLIFVLASAIYTVLEIWLTMSSTSVDTNTDHHGSNQSTTTFFQSFGSTNDGNQSAERIANQSVNLFFVVVFTVDILLRLIHEGCHTFWFDLLSIVDVAVVIFDYYILISDGAQALMFFNTLRILKGLRLLRILRIARSSRSAIALQDDVKRRLVYRDLFALDLLENEFESMSDSLKQSFPEWKTLSEKAKYDIIVIQTIALRLKHVCKFDVTLVHRDGRVYCLVGHGDADLLSEAQRIDYVLQLHNNPFSTQRKRKIREHSLPKESLYESLEPSANWLRLKIQSELKGTKMKADAALKNNPVQRKSIFMSQADMEKISQSAVLNENENEKGDGKASTSSPKPRTQRLPRSRSISTASIFKNEFSLDPNLDQDTEIHPYTQIVAGLTKIGHAPYQKGVEDPDSIDAVYYSPHAPFVNKSHTKGLYRTYAYDVNQRRSSNIISSSSSSSSSNSNINRFNDSASTPSSIASGGGSSKRNIVAKRSISLLRSIDRERLMLSLMNKHLNMPYIQKTVVKDMYWLHREDVGDLEEKLYGSKMITSTKNIYSKISVLHALRNYYGEAVALNYGLTSEMGERMTPVGAVGLLVWLILITTAESKDVNYRMLHRIVRVGYTIFILFWGRYFRNEWKRMNAELNLVWGNEASQRPERPRVEFRGVLEPDPITDELRLYRQNSWAQLVAYVVSWSTTIFLGGISIIVFVAVLYVREYLFFCAIQPELPIAQLLTRGLGSLLFGLQIIVSEVIFKKIALLLTEHENHRRGSVHRAHFVAKAFIFSLINNFASALYMTYFDAEDVFRLKGQDGCRQIIDLPLSNSTTSPSSMNSSPNLSLYETTLGKKAANLTFLFLAQIVLGNLQEFMLPIIEIACHKHKPCHSLQEKVCCCGDHHEKDKSETTNQGTGQLDSCLQDNKQSKQHQKQHEKGDKADKEDEGNKDGHTNRNKTSSTSITGKRSVRSIFGNLLNQAYLVEYDFIEEYDNLSDLIVAYTFATAFAAAFPLGSTLANISLGLELRVDLYQQSRHYRRPYPAAASKLAAAELLLGYTETFAWFNNGVILVVLEFQERNGLTNVDGQGTVDLRVLVWCLVLAGFCLLFANLMIYKRGNIDKIVQILENRFKFRALKVMMGAKEMEEAKAPVHHHHRRPPSNMKPHVLSNRTASMEIFYDNVKEKFDEEKEAKVSVSAPVQEAKSRKRKPHKGLTRDDSVAEFLHNAKEMFEDSTCSDESSDSED
jgi:hypothetical protein